MNLQKISYFLLIPLSLFFGCKSDNVVQTEVVPSNGDCSVISPNNRTAQNFFAYSNIRNQIQLFWFSSSPQTLYKIYRNNQFVEETGASFFADNFNTELRTRYEYKVISGSSLNPSKKCIVTTYAGYLDEINQEETFNFTLYEDSEVKNVIQVDSTLNLNSYYQNSFDVYNSAGNEKLFSFAGSSNTSHDATIISLPFPLKAGNYSVKLQRSGGGGNYYISNTETQTLYTNDQEPNNLLQNAISASPDVITKGHLGYIGTDGIRDETDFYKITLLQKKDITFSLDLDATLSLLNTNNFAITIFKSDGTTIERSFNGPDGFNQPSFSKDFSLNAGTYFLKINSANGYGGYEFKMCSRN